MKQMTLQRSLFFSIGIHVLLFGTAIAVAGYAGGALRGRHDTSISVALVGSDVIPGSTRATNPVVQHRKASQALPTRDTDMPPFEAHPADAVGVIVEQARTRATEVQELTRKTDTVENAESSGKSSGMQFGLVPPGQWAMISAALEQAKIYPRLARERGIQGVVHVRFKLKSSGDVERAEIVRSSGYAILDNASLKAVYRASPMPYVSGWVEVPIAYMLK